eukprot:s48_g43.t1
MWHRRKATHIMFVGNLSSWLLNLTATTLAGRLGRRSSQLGICSVPGCHVLRGTVPQGAGSDGASARAAWPGSAEGPEPQSGQECSGCHEMHGLTRRSSRKTPICHENPEALPAE